MYEASKARPVYRESDSELVGYVMQAGNTWSAMTLFGYPIKQLPTQVDAISVVQNEGLQFLMGAWQFRLDKSADWEDCVIIEASSGMVRVARMDGFYPDTSTTYVVPHPVIDYLRK